MPIDLNAPLVWTRATQDGLRFLQSLQGNILKGHGRDFTANIFFRFDRTKTRESRRILRELANFHLTSAHRQLLDAERFKSERRGGGAFTHLALSFQGYEALGLTQCAPQDTVFRAGMKDESNRKDLNDPPVDSWETPFREDLHGVVLAAQETEGETAKLAGWIRDRIEGAGGAVLHVQRGKALKNAGRLGIEHFGYVDGRSQPLLLEEDIARETSSGGTSRWNPAFPLRTVLIQDPGVNDPLSFGSLFVFRKLEQDVRGFKKREQELADALKLKGHDRELAGALTVGRFEDGTPVTLSREARSEAPPNDFEYEGDAGTRCPFHAHIRKINPRGSSGKEPLATERDHLFPRRGIPFEDAKRLIHPDELPEAEDLAEFNQRVAPLLPTGGVGLLFMAYNRDIAQQFKFTQQRWANETNSPTQPPGAHGIDPLIGQTDNIKGHQKLPKDWDNPGAGTHDETPFGGFVKMRGGEYFFSPSLTFLRRL